MHVLILHDAPAEDARPDESDTWVQVETVERALARLGHSSVRMAFAGPLEALAERLRSARADVAFNLVESVARSGRLIHFAPGLLDGVGLPFAGSGDAAMLLSSGKRHAKRVLEGARIATPPWYDLARLATGASVAPGRYLVKSVWEHGSLGLEPASVFQARDAAALRAQLEARMRDLGGDAIAEAYVHGREFNVALLASDDGPECLPIPEILFEGIAPEAPRVVGYRAKWDPDSPEYVGTPRRFLGAAEEELAQRLRALALATWHAFELAGWARVDLRVDADGKAFVIDVNANPCLSPDAGFAATLEAAGIPFERAIERILLDAGRRSRHATRARVPHPTATR